MFKNGYAGIPTHGKDAIASTYAHDPRIFLVIARSVNGNLVVYSCEDHNNVPVNPEGYWLDLDPKYRHKYRNTNRCELNFIQKRQAYGFTSKPTADGRGLQMFFTACPDRTITVRKVRLGPHANKFRAVTRISGVECFVDHIWVESGMLTVSKVELIGTPIRGGPVRKEVVRG
jgi:hypothetical protein